MRIVDNHIRRYHERNYVASNMEPVDELDELSKEIIEKNISQEAYAR